MVADLPQDWKPEPFKGQTIDIGVPQPRHGRRAKLNALVSDYHLDMLEHDGYLVAQGCDRTTIPMPTRQLRHKCIARLAVIYLVESSNSTDVSYHAVRAYYDIHSKLRQAASRTSARSLQRRRPHGGLRQRRAWRIISPLPTPTIHFRTAAPFMTPAMSAAGGNARILCRKVAHAAALKISATCCAAE